MRWRRWRGCCTRTASRSTMSRSAPAESAGEGTPTTRIAEPATTDGRGAAPEERDPTPSHFQGAARHRRRLGPSVLLLSGLLLLVACVAVSLGPVQVPLTTVWRVML